MTYIRQRPILLVDVNPSLSILGQPPDATIGVAYSYTFTYFGGTAPYKCTVVGSVPSGWSFNTTTGVLSHSNPTTPGPISLTLKLRDADYRERTQTFTWDVIALPLQITNSPPNYNAGAAQTFNYVASGGVPPYTWSVPLGILPPGITVDADGTFHGTSVNPSGSGTAGDFFYLWDIRVIDSVGKVYQVSNVVKVTAVAISISNAMADYAAGAAQAFTYNTTGGTGATTWAVVSGALPGGLSLSGGGLLSGTTVNPSGTGASGTFPYNYSVRVTDAGGTIATLAETVVVTAVAISITNAAPDGTNGVSYSHTYTTSGGTGTKTWSVASGSVPAGLSLSSSGVLSGTPITGGTSTFTVRVTDAGGTIADLAESVSIASDPYAAQVVALLHLNGTNGSTTLTDVIGNTWAVTGSASLNTTTKKFGTASLSSASGAGGAGSTLGSGSTFGTGDFTIEFWMNWTSVASGVIMFDLRDSTHANEIALYTTGGTPNITLFAAGANRITGSNPSTGTWYHIALCRASGTTRLFVNGTQVGSSYTDSNNYANTKCELLEQYNTAGRMNGFIDEVRITKAARYTSNFTAPSAEFAYP